MFKGWKKKLNELGQRPFRGEGHRLGGEGETEEEGRTRKKGVRSEEDLAEEVARNVEAKVGAGTAALERLEKEKNRGRPQQQGGARAGGGGNGGNTQPQRDERREFEPFRGNGHSLAGGGGEKEKFVGVDEVWVEATRGACRAVAEAGKGGTLIKVLKNLREKPENEKFRQLRFANKKIAEDIVHVESSCLLLELVGFETWDGPEGEELLVLVQKEGERYRIDTALILLERAGAA